MSDRWFTTTVSTLTDIRFLTRVVVTALRLRAASIFLVSIAMAICQAFLIQADAQNTDLRFEVASIKSDTIDDGRFTFALMPGGRLRIVNNRMRNVILNAYGPSLRLVDAPDWIDSDHYDIEAKAERTVTWEEMQRMLQALLEDRFKLKLHRETRLLPVYLLTVAKGGAKLKQSLEGSCADPKAPRASDDTPRVTCGNNVVSPGAWNATKVDTAGMTVALSRILRSSVIDETGLTGFFDIHLEFARDPLNTPDGGALSIFTAMQEQLGLKLDSDKRLTEVLVLDHIERPTEN